VQLFVTGPAGEARALAMQAPGRDRATTGVRSLRSSKRQRRLLRHRSDALQPGKGYRCGARNRRQFPIRRH
jgi:hypothetical protein